MPVNSEGISLAAGFNYALAFALANRRLVQDIGTGMLVMTANPVQEEVRA